MTKVIRILIGAMLCIGIGAGAVRATSHAMPRCYEDEVLVGSGDFSGGYWTDYVCEPLDNLSV